MDPLEFRLAHLDNDRIREVLIAATRKFGWEERRKQQWPNRAVGLACGTEKNSVVAACVEVEVDRRTGTPRLLEICEAFECGAVLNPANLKAQVEGCIVMGLGAALREELLFANGKLKNGRFSAYRVPRFRDVPKIDVVLLDKKDAEPVGAGGDTDHRCGSGDGERDVHDHWGACAIAAVSGCDRTLDTSAVFANVPAVRGAGPFGLLKISYPKSDAAQGRRTVCPGRRRKQPGEMV